MENYHYLKAVLANYVYRVNAIVMKTPTAFLASFDKLILLTYLKKVKGQYSHKIHEEKEHS